MTINIFHIYIVSSLQNSMSGVDAKNATPPEGALFSQSDVNFPFMVEDPAIEIAALRIWDSERRSRNRSTSSSSLSSSERLPGARTLMIASGGETAFALAALGDLFQSGLAVDMNPGQVHACHLKVALFKVAKDANEALRFLQNDDAAASVCRNAGTHCISHHTLLLSCSFANFIILHIF